MFSYFANRTSNKPSFFIYKQADYRCKIPLGRFQCGNKTKYSKATSTNQFAGHTDGQQTLHEPNGSITTAWDTPDDGPKKARNM
jgi:hypothetical protein